VNTKSIEEHYSPTIGWISGLFLMLLWAFLSTYGITPSWFGPVFSIGIQLLIIISVVHLISLTKSNLLNKFEFVNEKSFKRAWLETKR
jgi:uncharacterized membrane protein